MFCCDEKCDGRDEHLCDGRYDHIDAVKFSPGGSVNFSPREHRMLLANLKFKSTMKKIQNIVEDFLDGK